MNMIEYYRKFRIHLNSGSDPLPWYVFDFIVISSFFISPYIYFKYVKYIQQKKNQNGFWRGIK